jgi:hypothetical protein
MKREFSKSKYGNAIRIKEREMNEVLYGLYNLSSNERILIEKDCAMRPVL